MKFIHSDDICFSHDGENFQGEYKKWEANSGKLEYHFFYLDSSVHGEYRIWTSGELVSWCLVDRGETFMSYDPLSVNDGETLARLERAARDHGFPLLSDIPLTDEDRTMWNLKYPKLPTFSHMLIGDTSERKPEYRIKR